jgi:hypothetical protein
MQLLGLGISLEDRTPEQIDSELARKAAEERCRRPWYGLGVLPVDLLQAVAVPQLGQGYQVSPADAAERMRLSAASRFSPLFGVEDICIAAAVILRPFITLFLSVPGVRYVACYPGNSLPASTPDPCSASERLFVVDNVV